MENVGEFPEPTEKLRHRPEKGLVKVIQLWVLWLSLVWVGRAIFPTQRVGPSSHRPLCRGLVYTTPSVWLAVCWTRHRPRFHGGAGWSASRHHLAS